MGQEIQFTVNGDLRTVQVDATRRLVDVLREDLGLTGTKEGCGRGECGSCTVLLDGQPVNACLVPAFQVEGREVVTVEGLGRPGDLHPVQAAFLQAGAVQCGYCTPGMVVATAALVRDRLARSREEIRQRLSGNVCRCTGYVQIVDAAERLLRGQAPTVVRRPFRVGENAPRVDAEEKVTGVTRFTADIPLPPGTLHGVTVRAHRVHARLWAIHADEALQVPGVVRVLTWQDVPGELHYGNAFPDQPVLVKDRVRFWGEAVAVVLAETLEAAREGARRVTLELEDLPPVCSAEAALAEGAPRVHADGNLLVHQKLRKGDVDSGFREAEVVIERRYTTPAQEHLCLEPEAALVIPGADGSLTVRAPSQNVFFDRHHLCRTLGLDRKQVRVIQEPTGAAFGSREDPYAQIHAALGALVTGRPVRIAWTREETQVVTTKRHPATMTYRVGATREGRIVALQADVLFDTGAYASWAPNISRKALVHAAGPYDIPNVRVDVRAVYTNNGVSGAFRGFGAPQVLFACESLVDELAAELGMDAVALRRLNHLAPGRITATGQVVEGSCGLQECLDRALAEADRRAALRPPPAPHVLRGRGISTIHYGIGYGNAIPDIGSATVELCADGVFEVRCGAVDYGQGAVTVFHQVAGEVLGVDRLRVITGDSQETPDSGSTVASRQTYISGEAVRQAADRLRVALLELGAKRTGHAMEDLLLSDEGMLGADGTLLMGLPELHEACQSEGVATRRQARFRASTNRLDPETGLGNAYWPYAFACHVAEVEVDRRTGNVRVVDLVAAHDVGRIINPRMAEGQVTGGVAQGLGFALLEDHRLAGGVPQTLNLDTYRVPGPCDVPEVVPILVEAPEPTGPFGAKGVGEPVLVAVAPAVANAVAAATGIRLRSLPIRPEVLRAALAAPVAEEGP